MALPPIVTNAPVLKALTGTQDKSGVKKSAENTPAASPQDTVTLSAEALKILDENNKVQSENQARQTAADIGNALAKDQSLTLAKDSTVVV